MIGLAKLIKIVVSLGQQLAGKVLSRITFPKKNIAIGLS
jgi:hypothetical protein